MDFPASNLSRVESRETRRLRIFVKFLGLLGPQGALPLATTEESLEWFMHARRRFPRFLDLFNHRFLQLFFRAWADARPIAQHDRPKDDRFVAYIGSMIGIGSQPHRDLDAVPDAAKLAFAGLIAPQAKSASRLRSFISGSVRRQGRDRRIRRQLARLRARPTARGSGNRTAGSAPACRSAPASSASRTRSASASSPRIMDAVPSASCRPATSASRWPTRYSSISAISSTGRRSWRFRPARSSRCGSASSGSSAGPAGWRRTGPRRTHIDAMRASILPNACTALLKQPHDLVARERLR